MTPFEQQRSTTGFRAAIDPFSVRAILGLALFWAWVDAALVGIPMARMMEGGKLFGDLVPMISVATCIAVYLLCFISSSISTLLRMKPTRWTAAACGCAGTFLVHAYSTSLLTGMLILGLVFIGIGMGVLILIWANDYASDSQNRGHILVAGSIALSFPIYLLAIELSSWIQPFVVSLLPCASAAFIAEPKGTTLPANATRKLFSSEQHTEETSRTIRILGFPRNTAFWFFAFGLVFGIMQHFSVSTDVSPDPILMDFQQSGRALAAIVFFVGLYAFAWKPHTAYRLSTALVLAGLVLLPFLGTEGGFAAGFIAHAAYGFFECMTWAIVFETMKAERADAGLVAGPARLLSSLGLLIGTIIIVCTQDVFLGDVLQTQGILSSSVCILVIASMLVLDVNTDDNVWALMKSGARSRSEHDAEENIAAVKGSLKQDYGLTDREIQICLLLAQGRTSPYISQELLIGVNTVNTHKRRLYTKLDVHDKQELIDLINRLSG